MEELKQNKIAQLETILFVYGEAINIAKLSEFLELNLEDTKKLVKEYDLLLKNDLNRGLILLIGEDKIQLGTKPEFSLLIEKIIEKEINEDLTPAALETLSLVLYFSPISKSKIDYHRGVDSGFILKNLMLKGLIERKPNPQMPNSYLYYPTLKLFRHLGISSQNELPDYLKFQDLNKKFEYISKNSDKNNEENNDLNKNNSNNEE